MTADYDSEADALRIDLMDALVQLDHGEYVEGTSVIVNFFDGDPACIEVLGAAGNTSELKTAAAQYGLDGDALMAASAAALAAPDRTVRVQLGTPA